MLQTPWKTSNVLKKKNPTNPTYRQKHNQQETTKLLLTFIPNN